MTLTPVRQVQNLERYSVARSNAETYYNVVLGARLQQVNGNSAQTTLPKDKAQWLDLLSGPLTWLIQKHPALSVVIGDHLSAKPTFLRLPSIDLSRLVRVTRIQQRAEISLVLEDEHAAQFDLLNHEIPLWRIVVVHVEEDDTFYLLYCFQHVIGDGRSAQTLTEQLVQQLNIQTALPKDNKTQLPTVVVPPNDPLPPSLEMRHNCRPSVSTLIKEATLGLLLPGPVKRVIGPKHWAGEFDTRLDVPHLSQASAFHLTREETSQLLKAAKEHKTTVQAILFVAANFAIKSMFLSKIEHGNSGNDKKPTTTKDKLSFSTPVSLRPLLTPAVDLADQGTFTSEIITKNIRILLETGFWELGQKYRQQIVRGTTTPKGVREMLQHVGLLEYLPKQPGGWEDFLRGLATKEHHGRCTTLMLSNLGKGWDQPETDQGPAINFKVQDAIFSQSTETTGSAFALGAATAGGILSVTATWQKAAFSSRERGDLYLQEVKRILLQAIEPERKNYTFREAVLSAPTTLHNKP
ncbi:hypothetical protein BGX34_009006 [Mortierella sp. NVP85]|nr:hypothetical protein BGX34_009006 [Mortierella sp. NVP85]